MVLLPPPLKRGGFWRQRKRKILLLPPPLNGVVGCRRARKNHATTPPPPLNGVGFRRPQKISATTPPPTESRRLGTPHERGRLFRKILDLRLCIHNLRTHIDLLYRPKLRFCRVTSDTKTCFKKTINPSEQIQTFLST